MVQQGRSSGLGLIAKRAFPGLPSGVLRSALPLRQRDCAGFAPDFPIELTHLAWYGYGPQSANIVSMAALAWARKIARRAGYSPSPFNTQDTG